ncbi:phage tail protein [Salmonella enterica]|uniref:tail spike protein n=2 Tax=Salmonella enterica TaxID=28901 RepID=UPI000FB9FA5C|nr:tail spike protein [Salmonella enterica]EAA6335175.1 phage tail protein [Salmonella enterica subsp. enterica serovar Coeln]EAP2053553.1 phage tail protein [Salmonella enterica subsp. enterica serovar 4,[5],12:i:-]EBS3632264.1 phage tail protein [Salmonella enterica subsp. enterica serovar Reading]ECH7733293.1 phage tail protein [Salmonella enterica subsp. enterica]ECP5128055.1 phage tail protein [Salmonella enterica subsp. enterica serovar Heidelberg]ECT5078622.1 phage tail protein [Salmon
MTTYNTGNPLGSAAAKDLYDNAENFDHLSNDQSNEKWPDRFGRERLTWHGIEKMSQEAISSFGYITLKSFQLGAPLPNNELTIPNQALQDETDGEYYRWDGVFPKAVPAGSTPESTGGIGVGKWLSVGDAIFRQEANKKFKYSVKLSDYITLQEAATAAVDGLLIDIDYNFTDGETVDFGGKVLTIICKENFVADGSLIFTNLGAGSTIEDISLKSESTPFVIYRFDENGAWLDSASVLSGLSQRRDKGYQPTVNDMDIWDSLSPTIQNQNINCELILGSNCSGVRIIRPVGEFAIIRSIMNNNVTVEDPDFLGGKGGFGSIVFANYDGTAYGYGNKVIGGRVRYGSFSSVAFLRNKGYEGGVWDFESYRCGESGTKTWQNEVGPRSARCYELTFENIISKQPYYDGIDGNADYGTVTSRVDDYPVSQYPSGQLPTKHRIRNVFTEDAKGVGAWWDGQGVYVENVTTKDSHKTGIWSRGTNCILVNVTTIGCNSDNGSYNHLTCEGADQIIGVSVTVYSGIGGYAIYAPASQAANIYTNKGLGAGAVLLTAINNSRLGNTEIASQTGTATLRLRPNAYLVSNDGVKIEATTQISTPGAESARIDIFPVHGGTYNKGFSLNYGGTGQATIPTADDLLGDSAITQNGSLAFYFEAGVLKVLYKRPDGTYNRATIG